MDRSKKEKQALKKESIFIKQLIQQEKERPLQYHYITWKDMDLARNLEDRGLLREGRALGCFFLTNEFRELYMNTK
mgnify:CR=1 FL=1